MIGRWSVLWAAVKGFFTPGSSGFQSVVQLALDALNTFLAADDVASKVREGHRIALRVYEVLDGHRDLCPKKWEDEFAYVMDVVKRVVDAFEDGAISEAEADGLAGAFRQAYARWCAD